MLTPHLFAELKASGWSCLDFKGHSVRRFECNYNGRMVGGLQAHKAAGR